MVYTKAAVVIAAISIFINLVLIGLCIHHARKFWEVLQGRVEGGLYAHPKFVFFVVMGLSALLEIPTFIGCVINRGPYECVWNEDGTHNFAWACHWIASCGFMYSVMSTAILWSDVIQHRDGHFFNTAYPLDKIKFRFRLAFLLYCLVVVVTLLTVVIDEGAEKHKEVHTHSSHAVAAISYCVVPAILVLITCMCFNAGLRLQHHVLNMQLDSPTLRKVLFKLNATLFAICASYIVRAVMLLSLYDNMPSSYQEAFQSTWHYSVWVPVTQWFPYLFCSFCLVDRMKYKANAARKESTNSNNVELNHSPQPERAFSTDSTASDLSRLSHLSHNSHTISAEGPSRSLAYLVSQLRESGDDRGSVEHNNSHSINNPINTIHNLENSHSEDVEPGNFFDATASPDRSAVRHHSRPASGLSGSYNNTNSYGYGNGNSNSSSGRDGVGGVDHFFTTSALHSRSNSTAQP